MKEKHQVYLPEKDALRRRPILVEYVSGSQEGHKQFAIQIQDGFRAVVANALEHVASQPQGQKPEDSHDVRQQLRRHGVPPELIPAMMEGLTDSLDISIVAFRFGNEVHAGIVGEASVDGVTVPFVRLVKILPRF